MKCQIFAIYDSVSETFTKPFASHSVNTARREIADVVNQKESKYSKHSEDFSLFHLGSYDENTALFKILTAPTSVTQFLTLKENGNNEE